jgi:hypothetical protein
MALRVTLADLETGNPGMALAHLTVLQRAWARFGSETAYVVQGIGDIMVELRD